MTHTWRPVSMNAKTEADPGGVISGKAWSEFCEAVRRTGEKILNPALPATDLDRSTGFKHLMAMLQVGINQLLATLGPPWRTDAYKYGHDCSDTLYRSASVDGTSTYRVTGQVGSARFLSFQTEGMEGTVATLRSDELDVDSDGRFEIWLSPQEHDGDWLRTTDQTDQLFVRQFFSDWENEAPASMTIERVGGPEAGLAPHPGRPEHVAAQFAELARWFDDITEYYIAREIRDRSQWRNAFPPPRDTTAAGGDRDNIMAHGHFDIEPGEALLIEVKPARARYWSLMLANPWRESLDYWLRQTSLNDHQAVLDSDGWFRAVLAHADPGVPNWLDTMGHTSGAMVFRWVVTDGAPDARCTVVPHAAVREHLPAGTPVVSPTERAAVIARRGAQVARRFAP
jgi:hypothetical protein